MTTYPITGNTYPVKDALKALGCKWDSRLKHWYTTSPAVAEQALKLVPAERPKPETQQLDGVAGVVALLDTARQHLKFPAILVRVGETDLRLSLAGGSAKVPGAINVTDVDGRAGERVWYGRVKRDGAFEPSFKTETAQVDRIMVALRALAADPAGVAAAYGKLTGRCCFCNTALTDERSTAVGYGETCAKHWGVHYPTRAQARAVHAKDRAAADDAAMDAIVQAAEREEDERVAAYKRRRDRALVAA